MRDYSKIVDGEDKQLPFSSSFLWAYKDHLFHIMPDGLVEEVEDYEAIGSGADAALASLKHTTDEPIYDRLIKALDAAADISLYVADPYVVMDTNECELRELSYEYEDDEDNEDNEDNEEITE